MKIIQIVAFLAFMALADARRTCGCGAAYNENTIRNKGI